MKPLNVLSLFAGIGGLELGLERAGMTTVGQVEIDPFCRRVLEKHWPEVPRHDDVRTAAGWWGSVPRPAVDVICGGFPCQPFSKAGKQLGVADDRWGWPWFETVIRAIRPRYVIVENVARLISDRDAFGCVLGDLARLGFDAEWGLLSAASVGALHARERLFVVAHTNSVGRERVWKDSSTEGTERSGRRQLEGPDQVEIWAQIPAPDVRGVAHGLPHQVDRVRSLGNAVVPQVAELVGRMIVAHQSQLAAA